MSYYFSKTLEVSFDEAIDRITQELKKQGFGILTDIDVRQTLKRKLDAEFENYRILSACNPPFAYRHCRQNIRSEPCCLVMSLCNTVGTIE